MRAKEFIIKKEEDFTKENNWGLSSDDANDLIFYIDNMDGESRISRTFDDYPGFEYMYEFYMKHYSGGNYFWDHLKSGLEDIRDGYLEIDKDIDEGWKDKLAGAALGIGSLLGFHGANQPKAPPAPAAVQPDLSKTITGSPLELTLKNAAEKAGIMGHELSALLSQAAHETLNFKKMSEIGGSLDFRKYDPKYAPTKAKALGNIQVGDGEKYKGRGFLQITGRYNYKKAGEALGLPLEQNPELVEKPEVAAKVAIWYWKNRVAPKVGNFGDVKAVTKKINPGLQHLDQRKEKFKQFSTLPK